MLQKTVVECAWREYREKLTECSALEIEWENQIEPCDDLQKVMRDHACTHAIENHAARIEFGEEWDRIIADYNLALVTKSINEQERKNEWETLTIVQCLLRRVHNNIEESIRTGSPCITIDSDPDEVRLALEDCHIVTRGCPWDVAPLHPDSMTAHLCLVWCEIPDAPPLPPVEEPACTPEYVAREQAQFLVSIQSDYQAMLTTLNPYVDPNPGSCDGISYSDQNDILTFETILSEAGWAGCAPPLMCVDCEGMATILPVPNDPTPAEACHLHEEYLAPGQSNSHSFRCLDGTCASMSGRCNGVSNCADGSDELGCDADTNWVTPAYVSTSYACPADMHADVHFQCGNSMCIDKVGLCNGFDNCGDNSDEAHCSGSIQVSVEATSGRSITVETLGMHTGAFHGRDYNFDSLGHFAGKTFIKYSNDDKHTDHEHVMTKLRTVEPLTVFIVKMEDATKDSTITLSWLNDHDFAQTSYSGVSFSGIRQSEGVGAVLVNEDARAAGGLVLDRETRHKEWQWEALGMAPHIDHFTTSSVWSKTFEAGTISIPGYGGGDGSFLIFIDRPGNCEHMNHQMVQGCNNNPRDLEPDCGLADVRCCSMDGTSCNSGSFPQTFTFLDGLVSEGTACQAGQCNGVADTWCHSAVSFEQAQEICAATGERLCSRAEIESDVCCGTGCSHNAHLIWFSDDVPTTTLPPTPTGPEEQCNDRYEAEAAVRHGGVFASEHAGFTGDGFVDYLNPTGDYIEWSLPSCSGGEATLHFRYALASGDRPMQVLLNGVEVTSSLSFPPTGSWTVYRRTALTVTLMTGANTVRLVTTGASGANMDSLLVLSGTPSYYIATYGDAACPSGQDVMTPEECVVAHNQLELECSTCRQQSNTDWVGDNGGIPSMCSTRETNWGGQHHYHWDTSGVGTGVSRADLAPVCRV
jgi:hypothetical protein